MINRLILISCFIFFNTLHICSQDVFEQSVGISGKAKSYEMGEYDPVSYGIFYSKSFKNSINIQGELEYGFLNDESPTGFGVERIKEILFHPSFQYISSRETAVRFVVQVGPTLGYMDYLDQTSSSDIIGESKGVVAGGNGSGGLRIYFSQYKLFAQTEYNYNVLSNGFSASILSAKIGFDLFE